MATKAPAMTTHTAEHRRLKRLSLLDGGCTASPVSPGFDPHPPLSHQRTALMGRRDVFNSHPHMQLPLSAIESERECAQPNTSESRSDMTVTPTDPRIRSTSTTQSTPPPRSRTRRTPRPSSIIGSTSYNSAQGLPTQSNQRPAFPNQPSRPLPPREELIASIATTSVAPQSFLDGTGVHAMHCRPPFGLAPQDSVESELADKESEKPAMESDDATTQRGGSVTLMEE
jgi:hypothetical protein